ncbi:AaceriAER286Wp [[Ashbya] aceris (nom. inval.)]|nr:AaceriAER286Wp [[Ashbya] aceris (nom. inval.)]
MRITVPIPPASSTNMDGKEYLKSYGWKEGQALRKGGLKKPILVKHKRDKKGLGGAAGHDDGEAWWEQLFDSQLKGLDVSNGQGELVFKQTEAAAASVARSASPLYTWFVKGEGLQGTIKTKPIEQPVTVSRKRAVEDGSEDGDRPKKHKKHKKEKKDKKHKKEKKDKVRSPSSSKKQKDKKSKRKSDKASSKHRKASSTSRKSV